MRVTIHQPECMPWLGFFDKISCADKFVVLDNVQFRKNYFQNRNKIRTADGWIWFTIPVSRHLQTKIKDVKISGDIRWKDKWRNSIRLAYDRAKYFDRYAQYLDKAIVSASDNLCDLNIAFIKIICGFLGIKTEVIRATELEVEGIKSDLILNICKKLNADEYISGVSGKEYLKTEDFDKNNIRVVYQEFYHPIYKQLHDPFMPCMSVIDLLFNYGDDSLDVIHGKGVPVMDKVFL